MRSRAVRLPLRRWEHTNSIQSRSRFNSIIATRQSTPTTITTIENRRSLSESINRTFVLSSASQPRLYSSSSSSSSSAYHSAAPALQISVSFDAKIPPEELEHVDVLGDCVAVDPSMLALKSVFFCLDRRPHIITHSGLLVCFCPPQGRSLQTASRLYLTSRTTPSANKSSPIVPSSRVPDTTLRTHQTTQPQTTRCRSSPLLTRCTLIGPYHSVYS